MAKDDYYTLVAKILVYLYRKLKGHDVQEVEEYLQPNTADFPVSQEYFNYVLEQLSKQGMIDGVKVVKEWGGDTVRIIVQRQIRILPPGIDYLRENKTIRKIIRSIPKAASIADLFVP